MCYLYKWKNKSNKKRRAFICLFSESSGKGVMSFSFNGLKQKSLKIIMAPMHVSFDCSSIEKWNNSCNVRHKSCSVQEETLQRLTFLSKRARMTVKEWIPHFQLCLPICWISDFHSFLLFYLEKSLFRWVYSVFSMCTGHCIVGILHTASTSGASAGRFATVGTC